MGGGVIGIVLSYWFFLLGALFVARMLNMAQDSAGMIQLVIVVTVVFFGFQFLRQFIGNKK